MNTTDRRASPTFTSIISLIDDQVKEQPRALAVADGDVSLTYAALGARSNLIATYLRSVGVGRDVVVGVALKRSSASIVAALGVMRAGGAYLPLNPNLPSERLRSHVIDSGAQIVLTDVGLAKTTWSSSVRTVTIAGDGTIVGAGRTDVSRQLDHDGTAFDDLAYVIYTSGSSGKPKGVEITHGGLWNLVEWHRSAFDVRNADRGSHICAVGFDAGVWEVWPYLVAGASVHVAGDAVVREPLVLRDWLIAQAITVCFASAPLAERLIDLEWPPASRLRTLLTGADTLHKYPSPTLPFELVNNYGPTETTVVATSGSVSPLGGEGLPSIGRPIRNVRIDIVDPNGERVALGVAGEIWITGPGVARGYRGHPELSALKFIPDPFDASSTQMMYRTGDRGRLLADGRLAFLGRMDDQIKIRGFRVEPSEIETVVNRHPAVRENAVILHEFNDGEQRLVDYIVWDSHDGAVLGELRAFLAAHLPNYMIPSTFVALTSLPLTQNGKIDRMRLGIQSISNALADTRFISPRTPMEAQIVAIIQPLLNIERLSVEDDFFALGGHSLLGTQVIARVNDTFHVRISLRFLFESPTISALALEVQRLIQSASIDSDEREATETVAQTRPGIDTLTSLSRGDDMTQLFKSPEIVVLHANGTATPLFYLHGDIYGGGLYSLKLAEHLAEDHPIYILPPHGVDGHPLPTTIEAMATEYVQIVRAIRPDGPYILGGWCNGGLVAFEMARQLHATGQRVRNVILIEVDDANQFLRIFVEAIDRFRNVLRIESGSYAGIVRFLARIPFQARRSMVLSSRNILLQKLVSSLLRVISRLRVKLGDGSIPPPSQHLLREFTRVGEAYLARRYEGKITVLLAQEPKSRHRHGAGWNSIAPSVDIQAIPGDHITCLTQYVRDTAKVFANAL